MLRKQIEAKKREKNGQLNLISATEPLRQAAKEPLRESSKEAVGQAGLAGLEGSRRSHLGNIEIESQLREVLAELNIEKISMKLKEKGVTSLEEFRNISS